MISPATILIHTTLFGVGIVVADTHDYIRSSSLKKNDDRSAKVPDQLHARAFGPPTAGVRVPEDGTAVAIDPFAIDLLATDHADREFSRAVSSSRKKNLKKKKKKREENQHEFQQPGPDDSRSPCPFTNALVNHGYFPNNRNGRGINVEQIAKFGHEVFGSRGKGVNLAIVMGMTYLDGATELIDIDELWNRPGEERDASMVFQDPGMFVNQTEAFRLDDANVRPETSLDELRRKRDEGLLQMLLDKNPGSDVLRFEDIKEFANDRILYSRLNNQMFELSLLSQSILATQYWGLLLIGSSTDLTEVPKQDVHNLLMYDKLPNDFVPQMIRGGDDYLASITEIGTRYTEEMLRTVQNAMTADLRGHEHRLQKAISKIL